MNANFNPGETYTRRNGEGYHPTCEVGRVVSANDNRVVMEVTSGHDHGIETFVPAFDLGWRLCG